MASQNQGNTPVQRRVSLTGFAKFVGARASGRLDCVREQISIYQGDYRPTAFYKDFTDALVEGRRAGTDELSLQRCVSKQSDDRRRSHYAELRQHWLAMPQWHLPFVAVGRTHWTPPGLEVSVLPELGLARSAKMPLVVKAWLQKDEPEPDAIGAIQWLLTHHMDRLLPGGTAAVLDLRREKLHVRSKRGYKRGYDHLLASEAASMASLWNNLAVTA